MTQEQAEKMVGDLVSAAIKDASVNYYHGTTAGAELKKQSAALIAAFVLEEVAKAEEANRNARGNGFKNRLSDDLRLRAHYVRPPEMQADGWTPAKGKYVKPATPPAADAIVFDEATADRAARALIPDADTSETLPDGAVLRIGPSVAAEFEALSADAPDGLVRRLRKCADEFDSFRPELNGAADRIEADALEIARWKNQSALDKDRADVAQTELQRDHDAILAEYRASQKRVAELAEELGLAKGWLNERQSSIEALEKRVAELEAALAKVQELKRDASPIVLAVYRELVAVGNIANAALKGTANG